MLAQSLDDAGAVGLSLVLRELGGPLQALDHKAGSHDAAQHPLELAVAHLVARPGTLRGEAAFLEA